MNRTRKDQNNQKPLSKIFKESFINVCSNSTSHAIPNIARTDSWFIKLFWSILFISGLGISSYYFYKSVNQYFSYETSVSIDKIRKKSDSFPAITICNLNQFQWDKTLNLENFEMKPVSDIVVNNDESSINAVKNALYSFKAYTYKYGGIELFEKIGFGLDYMLLSCYFNGRKCDHNNFTRFFTFDYGNCYIFNKENQLKIIKPGSLFGLQLELFVGYPGNQDFYVENRGVYLAVHNNSEIPSTKYDGLKIPVGFASEIGITRTFSYKLPEPYNECQEISSKTFEKFNSKFYDSIIKVSKYSKRLCDEICLQNLFIKPKCKCNDPSLPIIDINETVCFNVTQANCVNEIVNRYDSINMDEFEDYCPEECDNIVYDTSFDMSDYPTKYYYEVLSKDSKFKGNISDVKQSGTDKSSPPSPNITYELLKQSVLKVNIFYKDLGYTVIKESPAYSFESIIGIIGGQFGLFLGVSILTFFECFEFLFDIFAKIF